MTFLIFISFVFLLLVMLWLGSGDEPPAECVEKVHEDFHDSTLPAVFDARPTNH